MLNSYNTCSAKKQLKNIYNLNVDANCEKK